METQKAKPNRRTLSGRIDTWMLRGPYTWEKTWGLIKACAKSRDLQLGDSLDYVYHRFSAEDLEKLINPEAHLSAEDLEICLRGTEGWKVTSIHPLLSDAQLEVIARHSEEVVPYLGTVVPEWDPPSGEGEEGEEGTQKWGWTGLERRLTPGERLAILTVIREATQRCHDEIPGSLDGSGLDED